MVGQNEFRSTAAIVAAFRNKTAFQSSSLVDHPPMLLSYDLDFDFMTLIHDRDLDAMKMYLPTKNDVKPCTLTHSVFRRCVALLQCIIIIVDRATDRRL